MHNQFYCSKFLTAFSFGFFPFFDSKQHRQVYTWRIQYFYYYIRNMRLWVEYHACEYDLCAITYAPAVNYYG